MNSFKTSTMTCYNATCATPTTGTFVDLFTSAVQIFAASQCLISYGIIEDPDIPNHSKFDVIIVGAGTSGCVLAKRLCENKNWRILLIEAGDDTPIEAVIPNLDGTILRTKFDWQYLTTNDGIINQANINGSINWPRGKAIGGSSIINGMIYTKGNDNDYKIWYDAGNKEWSVTDVRRCFKKAENYQNMQLAKNMTIYEEYGHNGPLIINTFNSTVTNINEKLLFSFNDIDISRVLDLNTENMFGAGITSVTAANGERQSSNKAYLNTAKCRNQLVILKNTLVTKILINDLTKVAYGVTVKRGGKKITYHAKHEVILSAGAINSPQLLMLSGIGDKSHLCKNNIKVVVHSPMVGQNLQDHCIIPIIIGCNETNPQSSYDMNFDVFKYIYNKTGYLAHGHISDVLAFFASDNNAVRPDYQSHLIISWKNSSNIRTLMKEGFRYKDSVADPIVELNKNYTLFFFLFNLLHPDSRGNISLKSNNPEEHPFIYPNYFKDKNDLESAVTGIKMLTRLLDTDYFKSIGAFLARMVWPECDIYELDSRDYWKCVCINMVLTVYHPVGTSTMGPNPEASVVDGRLRVHKVKNLRVIDASIMPNITSGNTNGPTTMIAERGAELVIEDHEDEQ